MTDLNLTWDQTAMMADWQFANGDLVVGGDLESAVIVSLFSDARVADWVNPQTGLLDPHGWWGDSLTQTQPIGSSLWLLNRAVISNGGSLLLQAQDAAQASLQWMIDDGIAASVSVVASWINSTTIGIAVTITQPGPGQPFSAQYQFSWKTLPS